MNEKQVKELIIQKFGSINAFSDSINIANSTVVSILERGFLNAKLKNVFTICKALNINPEDLESGFKFNSPAIIHGDNNGIANLSGNVEGGLTINNHKKDEHSICREQEIADNSSEDLDIQEQMLKEIKTTNRLLEQILQELRK